MPFIGKGSDKGGRICPSPSNAPPIFTVIRHSSRIPFTAFQPASGKRAAVRILRKYRFSSSLTTFFCCHHPVWWIRQRPGHRAIAERDRFKEAAQAKPEGLQNVNVRIRESEALPQLVDEYLGDRPYLVDAMPTYLGICKPYRLTRDYTSGGCPTEELQAQRHHTK